MRTKISVSNPDQNEINYNEIKIFFRMSKIKNKIINLPKNPIFYKCMCNILNKKNYIKNKYADINIHIDTDRKKNIKNIYINYELIIDKYYKKNTLYIYKNYRKLNTIFYNLRFVTICFPEYNDINLFIYHCAPNYFTKNWNLFKTQLKFFY